MTFEQALTLILLAGLALLIFVVVRLIVKVRRGDFDEPKPTTSRQNGAPDNVDEHARSRGRPAETTGIHTEFGD